MALRPAVTHVVLHENGSHKPLTGETPPTDQQLVGVGQYAKSLGAGVYVGKLTGTGRDGNLTQVSAHNEPRFSFTDAKSAFMKKNGFDGTLARIPGPRPAHTSPGAHGVVGAAGGGTTIARNINEAH